MKKNSVLNVVALAFTVTLITAGCGENTQALKDRISDLESENAGLKAQIAILKDTFAQAKTAELKAALQPMNDALANRNKDGSLNTGDALPNAAGQGGNATQAAPGATGNENKATVTFIDLEETPTADTIKDLARLGLFEGMGNKFEPNKPITRAEYIEWLYKAFNILEPEAKRLRLAPQLAPIFKDVPASVPKYKYIQALANAGYSIGYEDGTFRPDKPLTREEMLGIKVGVDVGKTLPPWRSQMDAVWKFSDGKDVSERFTGYLNQDFYVSGPKGSNIHRAFGSIGAFKPKQPVLRYEAAATLWQMGQFGDTQTTNAGVLLKQSGR